jgi:hypothetical protein
VPSRIIRAIVWAWIANTDYEWYRFLSVRPDLDEVDFWCPSSSTFRTLSAGEPLFFRLKVPHTKIAGWEIFGHSSDVVLGHTFLKYISDAFAEQHARLVADKMNGAELEDPDEYRAIRGIGGQIAHGIR